MVQELESLLNALKGHKEMRLNSSLNLISSENILSNEVRALLALDFAGRYTSRDGFYRGSKYLDEIEKIGIEVAKQVFKAEYADLRSLSGHIATLAFISSQLKAGELIFCVSPSDGGYPGMAKDALPKVLGIKVEYLPFDKEKYAIDVDSTIELAKKLKPKLIIIDFSLILRRQPVRELFDKLNGFTKIAYDGSHVLGLIGGGEFQDPLREGAIALYGSTHKSFFGPQGGIILAEKQVGEEIDALIYPSIVDNAHWNRIAALTLALLELKEFGREYAKQVIRNSKALAKSLKELGLPIKGPEDILTETHQVYLNFDEPFMNVAFARELERANIITDSAIRLGTNEVTRLGMREQEMERIAELIHSVYRKENLENIKRSVSRLRSDFDEVQYRFSDLNLESLLDLIFKNGS